MVDGAAFDEMTTANGVRAPYGEIAEWLKIVVSGALRRRQSEADLLFRRLGITFAVYGEGGDPERLIPFDLIPRGLGHDEWTRLAGGLKQRVKALNAFIRDIYHDQEILKAGRIPADLVLKNAQYRSEMRGVAVTGDAYTTIAGIDLVRTGEDEFFVLEDNLRTPSGVSYMLENREAMMRLFPQLFARQRVAPVGHYPDELLQTLRSLAPETAEEDPTVVLMTPGAYNSAYFEHVFLAEQMGVELVEGQDLVVRDDVVYMRAAEGLKRVDVIYRRIDDDYLDPEAFNPESTLGVRGVFRAYRAGNVALANAIGTGVADDKAVYPYVPEMIRFYLGEEAMLRNVPTWSCRDQGELAYVLEQ